MMMYAAAGQCFCYLIITVLIRYNEKPGYSGSKEVASASVAFFFLYYVFFGIGWQGVPWYVILAWDLTSMLICSTGFIRPRSILSPCERKVPHSEQQRIGYSTSWVSAPRWYPPDRHADSPMHSGRDHTNRHPKPTMEILHHLDPLQRRIRPNRLFPIRKLSAQPSFLLTSQI